MLSIRDLAALLRFNPREMRRLLLASLICAGCGGVTPSLPPPGWFEQPPKSARTLYFVGDATGASDEGMARDLAVQKALFNLTVFVGAKVTSDFKAVDIERDGVSTQEVSMAVDVAGEALEIREVTVKQVELRNRSGGVDAYAMIEWPRAQYEALQVAMKNRAERALALYRQAVTAAEGGDEGEAQRLLGEAKKMIGVTPVPLADPEMKDTGVLGRAIDALGPKLTARMEEKKNVCAVVVRCIREKDEIPCDGVRAGSLKEAVTRAGRKVATEALPPTVIGAILESDTPKLDASVRSAACVVAAQFTSTLRANVKPFVFVEYAARAVVFDTATGRVVSSHEVPPSKMGHVNFEGAEKKGFDSAQKALVQHLTGALAPR